MIDFYYESVLDSHMIQKHQKAVYLNDEVIAAVHRWISSPEIKTIKRASDILGMNERSLGQKIRGERKWRVDELPILARAGVELPDLGKVA